MALDHFFADDEFLPAHGEGVGGDALEGVDVVEIDAVEVVHGGVEVARNGEVDAEKRPVGARVHHGCELFFGEDVVRGGGGADEDIDVVEIARPVVKMDGATLHRGGERDGAVVAAVGDEDGFYPARL